MLRKIIIVAAIVVGILLIAVAVILVGALHWWGNSHGAAWSAVYLDTGDLYFGHLDSDDSVVLSHAWYVQRSSQGGGPSINDFSAVLWKPEGTLRLNREHIVWVAPIAADSPLISQINARAGGAASGEGADGLKGSDFFFQPQSSVQSSSTSTANGAASSSSSR